MTYIQVSVKSRCGNLPEKPGMPSPNSMGPTPMKPHPVSNHPNNLTLRYRQRHRAPQPPERKVAGARYNRHRGYYSTGERTRTLFSMSMFYPPKTIMLKLLVSRTAVQEVRGSGTGTPEFVSVQTGGFVIPLAWAAVHVSAGCPMPPKIVIASPAGS